MTRVRVIIAIMLIVGFLAGCANMNPQQQRVLSGAAIGAGAGAVISGVSGGNMAAGSALGAAAGAVGGYLYDQTKHHHR